MISDSHIEKFREDGYVVLYDFFEPAQDLSPLVDSYTELLDALAAVYIQNARPDLHEKYTGLAFAERLAVLIGLSGGTVLLHLNPSLVHLSIALLKQQKSVLPSAQIPEMFRLIRNKKLLDAIECLIGPEISVSPIYNFNCKLAPKHLELVRKIARDRRRAASAANALYNFYVGGGTAPHTDASYLLPDARDSDVVTAWIPMTVADRETACLAVLPGSHRKEPSSKPISDVPISKALPIETKPGDLILFHSKLAHGSLPNESLDSVRWAFNFRYLPTEQSAGRPFLPRFVARSRSSPKTELRNPIVWSAIWQRALDNLATTTLPLPRSVNVSGREAETINAQWKALIPNDLAWLKLGR